MIYKNAPYEVVTAISPSSSSAAGAEVYGVRNNDTGVIEAYMGELPRAMTYADGLAWQLHHHDSGAYGRAAEDYQKGGGISEMLAATGDKKRSNPGFGGLNG